MRNFVEESHELREFATASRTGHGAVSFGWCRRRIARSKKLNIHAIRVDGCRGS